MGKVFLLLTVATAVGLGWVYYNFFGDLEPPKLPDYYWGPKSKAGQKEDTTIRPFKINIDEKILTDLKNRLKLEASPEGSRLTPPLEGIGFQYGFNTNFLKKVQDHWLNKYDWRAREKLLNKYPQFKTTINGIELHFQHIKYTGTKKYKNTRPLLMLHGWPGSFVEFQKSIPSLLEPKDSDINFELIVPSLPGYGFSEGSHKPGLGPVEMTQTFVKLMKRLGHEKFYVQGGDWGSVIATEMSAIYPENVVALHINMAMSWHPRTFLRELYVSIYPELFMEKEDVKKLYPLKPIIYKLLEETGYFHIQVSKPDTIGNVLSNTPTGLAAYILEKFSTWTDIEWRTKEDGGLGGTYYDMNELLDNIMVYWVTNSITTSVRLYSEGFAKRTFSSGLNQVPVKVPAGCMNTPNELFNGHTEYFLQDKFHNLLSFSRPSKGGHFPAFEVPDIFTKDVVQFFNLIERNTTVTFGTTKSKKL